MNRWRWVGDVAAWALLVVFVLCIIALPLTVVVFLVWDVLEAL